MSIVVVGGHDRMHEIYKGVCDKYGYNVKVYTQMPPRFDKVIGKPDGIVLMTGVVSHKMMITAIKEAKRKNIPLIRCQSGSVASLEESIRTLEGNHKN